MNTTLHQRNQWCITCIQCPLPHRHSGLSYHPDLVPLPSGVCQVHVAASARAACMSQLVYDNVEVMVEICQDKDLAAAFNPTGGECIFPHVCGGFGSERTPPPLTPHPPPTPRMWGTALGEPRAVWVLGLGMGWRGELGCPQARREVLASGTLGAS
jgi:hypothetical protein